MNVPKSIETRTFATSNGANLIVEDFGGIGDNLIFVHAAGYCARMYLPIATALRDRFHCWGFNARFHGGSTGGDTLEPNWETLASDLRMVTEAISPRPWSGFGHSYGATGLLLAEQHVPGTFESLYAYEPVFHLSGTPGNPNHGNRLSQITRKRRATFSTRSEAAANFSSKAPMSSFNPLVVDLYLETGVTRGLDQALHLSCPPDVEAEIYAWSFAHTVLADMPKVRSKVLIMAGAKTEAFSVGHLDKLTPECQDAQLRHAYALGHFGPFASPNQLAQVVLDFEERT